MASTKEIERQLRVVADNILEDPKHKRIKVEIKVTSAKK